MTAQAHAVDLVYDQDFGGPFDAGWKVICTCAWESWAHAFRSDAVAAHEAHVEREAATLGESA